MKVTENQYSTTEIKCQYFHEKIIVERRKKFRPNAVHFKKNMV